ncbi:tetratricopeptide repeat protein [Aquimarina sp. 2201CG1-2-11]|uniref:tetratricopeptide repeat protein n=1 Tax=Aquimarina discodermiae TaxID=3231043 RepID=UPI0034618FA9
MKPYISLLFCFLIGYVFSQENDTTLVRLANSLDLAIEDTTKVKALFEIGKYQLDRDFNMAEGYFNQGLDLIKDKNDNKYKNYRSAFYIQLGVVNRRKADYPSAINFYIKALEHYTTTKDTSKIADIYHNMALVYRYQKEHSKAINHYKKAIKLKKSVKDTFGLGAGYNMLGVSYRQNKQLDSALICYREAKKHFIAIESEEDLYRVKGNMAQLYLAKKNYKKSIELNLNNLSYYTKINNRLSMCVTNYNLSDVYKKTKEWKKSLKYINASIKIAEEEGFNERISVGYRRKSFLNSKMGDFEDAYQNYRKFNRKSDELFNLENEKKIQALELNYEFEKQKQTDSLRYEQEKREVALIAASATSKKRLYFILLLITSLGGVIIAFLIKRNYQQRTLMQTESYENEKKILNQEIKSKEEDVKRLIADNSMRQAFKENLLETIKKEVIHEDPKKIKESLNSLLTKLRLQINTENKLSGLQEKIDAANKVFDANLQNQFPALTKGEREVCALVRLNLSIKEIMTIRNVSSDSVKSMRRRIRKKMNIPQDIELEKFIQDLV